MSGSELCIFVCDSIAQNEQLSLAPGLTGHLCRMFSGKGGKMKKVILVGILIVLGGCSATQNMDKGLRALSGKKIDTAFRILGYPENKQEFNGVTVYIWNNSLNTVRVYTEPRMVYGTVGKEEIRTIVNENQYVPVTLSCRIQIAVDKNGYIKDYSYDDDGGCLSYSRRLEKYTDYGSLYY